MQPNTVSPQVVRPPLGTIAWGIVLNAVFPVLLYKLAKRYHSPSEFTALVIAALLPLGKSAFDLLHPGGPRDFLPVICTCETCKKTCGVCSNNACLGAKPRTDTSMVPD